MDSVINKARGRACVGSGDCPRGSIAFLIYHLNGATDVPRLSAQSPSER
jgi:hypothetical protein